MNLKPVLLAVLLVLTAAFARAQNPRSAQKRTVTVPHFAPPKVKTSWGNNSDSATITIDEALQLLAIPIRVTNDKKNAYAISTYQFLYKKRNAIESEESETGKIIPTSSVVAQQFRITPLPDIWVKTIRTDLKPGEELYFFDVVVKDNAGHLFFAPTLKVKIN